jgi:hypothetical protein
MPKTCVLFYSLNPFRIQSVASLKLGNNSLLRGGKKEEKGEEGGKKKREKKREEKRRKRGKGREREM